MPVTEGPAAPTPSDDGAEDGRSLRDLVQDRRLSSTALLAIAGLIALAAWLIVESVSDDSAGESAPAEVESTPPVAVSANGLATLVQASGRPIYWVGPRDASLYELRQEGGNTYVRYLPSGVKAGAPQALLTVATYAIEDAYGVTTAAAGQSAIPLPGGAVGLVSDDRPNSGYVAFPDVDYQVEVYDPDPAVVRELVTSGAVKPVPAPQAAAEPRIVSEDELVSLASELGRPVYWAGPRKAARYELTVSPEGGVYVRYLPPGTEVGSETPALTVVTYPVADAYAVTRKSGSVANAVTLTVPGGGVAVHPEGTPQNIHLAYPGQDVQVEVFSPRPQVGLALVRQGKIVPVG